MFTKIKKLKLLFLFIVFGYFFPIYCKQDNQTPIMTIFIHGIIKTPWTILDLLKIAHNNIATTNYKFAAEYLRKSHEYFLTQPMQDLGLKKVEINCKYPTSAASAIASIFEETECNTGAQNLYYTFGWSGFFSRYHRELESINLYNALIQELNLLKKENIYPKIRIVTFSHGGNVTLNMAKLIPSDNLPFQIDRLMLIGTPIQMETDCLILHPVFKEVYNFYSDGDIAQIADFLTTRYGVSNRIFKSRKGFALPDKLTQIQLSVTKIVTKKGKIIRITNSDPNHMELWTFGWIKRIYREGFPLNPLPMASLIPLIINTIQCIDENLSKHLQAHFIPQNELLIIKDKKTKNTFETNLSNKISRIKYCALNYKVEFPVYQHKKLVKDALNYAREQKKIIRNNLCKKIFKICKNN